MTRALARNIICSINFHPFYVKIRLTDICFADDLFFVAGATVTFFKTINNTLHEFREMAVHEFGEMAGFFPNLHKSLCFFVGVSREAEVNLGKILSIPTSTIPVQYLVVPLSTVALTAKDCRFFIDKVKNSINLEPQKYQFCGKGSVD
ncbi:hypothetical protein LIER_43067 [Lithospermum erythrorhizon]|uniref:Reverse transcriptase domain-containing protein n=1 Tax=Lithospermum erythrorhizon TaxID=34254 RepID=A0AAV3PF82_LITER